MTKANVEGKGGQATHVGVAKVPEPRLKELAKLYNPKKITYATVQYVDLGGMQKEKNRDALAPLREVDTIAHVLRVFDDPTVPHSEGSIDPVRDATNLELELILADHDQISRRLERVEKDLKKKPEPILVSEKAVLEKCKAHLEAEKPLRELVLTAEERKPIAGFLFLSQRPMLFVLNLGDDEAADLDSAVARHALDEIAPPARGLDGGLDRFGSGVHRQRRIEPGQPGEFGKEGSEAIVVISPRRDREAMGLCRERRQDARMSVAVTGGRIGTHHVDIAPSGNIPQIGPFSAREHHGKRFVIVGAVAALEFHWVHGACSDESALVI